MNQSEVEAIGGDRKGVAKSGNSGAASCRRSLPGGVVASACGHEPMSCSKNGSYAGVRHEKMGDSPIQQGMVDSAPLVSGGLNTCARTTVSAEQQGQKRMREGESSRKEGVLNWVDYDVDIVDNMKKTKRYTSERMANDLATRMSMSTSAEIEGCMALGGDSLREAKASPSPLSRLKKCECDCGEEKAYHSQDQDAGRHWSQGEEVVHACAAAVEFTPKQHGLRRMHEEDNNIVRSSAFITPIKNWHEVSNCSRYSSLNSKTFPGVESISPIAKREDFQGVSLCSGHIQPTSPSDMKHDGNADLRRTALVRLALRNSGDALHSSPG